MVKLINPFLAISCHGKFAGCIYQTGRTGQIVRAHTLQRKKPSENQIFQNYLFGKAGDAWRLLTKEEKWTYHTRASRQKMTGFNLYVKENIKRTADWKYGSAKYGSGIYR